MLEVNLDPPEKELRRFGFIALVLFGVVGGLVYWRGGLLGLELGDAALRVSVVLWALGGVSGALSLVAPSANRVLYVLLVIVTYPIGFVLSHVLLAALFYGMITPLGAIFRLLGRDPLKRKFDAEAESYFEPHRRRRDVSSYFKQF